MYVVNLSHSQGKFLIHLNLFQSFPIFRFEKKKKKKLIFFYQKIVRILKKIWEIKSIWYEINN